MASKSLAAAESLSHAMRSLRCRALAHIQPQAQPQRCLATLSRRPAPRPAAPTHQRAIRILSVGKRKNPRVSRFNNHPQLPILTGQPAFRNRHRLMVGTIPARTGIPAIKKGMTSIYVNAADLTVEEMHEHGLAATLKPNEGGVRIAATVLQMDRCQVIANKTRSKHGYYAVVVGEGWRRPERVGKAMMGVFTKARVGEVPLETLRAQGARLSRGQRVEAAVEEKAAAGAAAAQAEAALERDAEGGATAGESIDPPQDAITDSEQVAGLSPKKEVREFKVRDAAGLLPIGTVIDPTWFAVGQFVDARAVTKGKGFAGVMKRHGFAGQPASHGNSLKHRAPGSTGPSQGGGSRVHPGKKMPGNMGHVNHTARNLRVLLVDRERGIVVVGGCVAGPKGGLVTVQDAKTKGVPEHVRR